MTSKRKILIGLSAVFAIYLLVSVFLPSEVIIEKERCIKADKQVLFDLVNDLRNWDYWNPWHQMDKEWDVSYSDPSAGLAATCQWKSGSADPGNGKTTIVNTVKNDSIALEIEMEKRGISTASFHFVQKGDCVNVRWKMAAKTGFFGRIFPGLFMKDKFAALFDKGLNSLDSLSHTSFVKPKEGIAGVSEFRSMNVLCLADSCAERDVPFQISRLYGKIQGAMGSEVKIAGAPLCIYHGNSGTNILFEAAIPVSGNFKPDARTSVKMKQLQFPKVLVYNYYGTLSDIKSAYAVLASYMNDQGLVQNGNSIEEYVSDGGSETDPSKWLTRIYVPVE